MLFWCCRRTFRNAKWPTFWVPHGPQGLHQYRLRLIWRTVDWAPAAPAVVNSHEARAFAAWRTRVEGLTGVLFTHSTVRCPARLIQPTALSTRGSSTLLVPYPWLVWLHWHEYDIAFLATHSQKTLNHRMKGKNSVARVLQATHTGYSLRWSTTRCATTSPHTRQTLSRLRKLCKHLPQCMPQTRMHSPLVQSYDSRRLPTCSSLLAQRHL